MADFPWWTTLTTAELLDLRRRLLKYVKLGFGNAIKAELEDVIQQAIIVLFRHRESVKADDDGLFRYLKTVARNAALDRIRAARRRREHLPRLISEREHHVAGSPVAGVPPAASAEEIEKIWKIFCALDDLDRLVIWSHVVNGRSIRAIAHDLDLDWHRVAEIIEEALRRVRRQLTF